MAYTFLLTNGICGFPSWPNYHWTGSIGLDAIIWACLNLIVHGAAILQLLYDERPIKFKSEDERQVATYFLRRGGMQAMEASIVISRGSFRHISKGACILDAISSCNKLSLLIDGKAHYVRTTSMGEVRKNNLYSGMAFDIRLLNIFGVYLGFEASASFEAFADTDCLVLDFDTNDLEDLACNCGPSVSSYFRNFIMSIMATEWEFRTHEEAQGIPAKTSRGTPEPQEFFEGKRSSDFTDPLETWEIRRPTIRGVLNWVWKSFEPFMPPGTRHWTLPASGLLARNRTVEIGRRSELLSSHASSAYSEKRTMLQIQMLENEPSESLDQEV
eukprot:jgi/Picsp_1/5163/NSC_02526-R1_hypothetical protein CHLNCDRAFT_136738 [Chlorella variabilis]